MFEGFQRPEGLTGKREFRTEVLAEGVLLEGRLPTGLPFKIVQSRKSAVPSGTHLIMTGTDREPTPHEAGDLLSIALAFVEENFSGRRGCRITFNDPGARNRPGASYHMHIIIPGEREAIPRVVDPWPERAE